ncbi:hypothetical protein A2738_03385 [Candidatus Nomurabacteria bacterium RIFCSPHIGHO2_01_FULL_42_15]|uniref:Vitamin K epoxide reductase domain-containing protein n=1 Tax=Candidatus Nomurabacteria bacterium RIFCSPHIGHO2_01_FULL_42_15 TaxID=1801742 RepID=A0A1F6VDT1_9BACT|nr:MAG: hypothetical protein A2738_03385 [Candidatus Nomurabacteria bacterium RIFCSPHIGHO2_01_FULL_42_15]OGI93237.1 MAG: hypothetical protein A3A99_03220 [Candidatus Nomurabacteria bacterium RIFCSPLOWO2_01_FULL_41_18]
MQFLEGSWVQITIFVLGFFGFAVARHIYKHKDDNKHPLVCPIKFDCHTVVHSDYSKFFGVPVEIFGMIYYAFISFAYLVLVFFPMPSIMSVDLAIVAIAMSSIAFIFSLYLILVQIFILKKGCSWCIVSAFICFFIFILTMMNYDFNEIIRVLTV